MLKTVIFWMAIFGILVIWELVLILPEFIIVWLGFCIVLSAFTSWQLGQQDEPLKQILLDRFSFVLFNVGVLFWLLWLDFAFLKFFIAIIIWMAMSYAFFRAVYKERITQTMRLLIFFGGTFLWSTISYGLLTVIGWQLWQTLIVFSISFSVLLWTGLMVLKTSIYNTMRVWLLLLLIGVEFFSVVAWLPFTEVTLAIILSLFLLFSFDLSKYLVNPELIRRKIILRKILVYMLFLGVVLLSTPWS
jgi:hypothetical protein